MDNGNIRNVVALISADNGGHLLSYYGASELGPEQVIGKMIAFASIGKTDADIAAIEAHLATLTPEQQETVAQGEETEADALMTPEVKDFLTLAFEAPILESNPLTDITRTARELREQATEMQSRLVEGVYYADYDQASADLRVIPSLLDHLTAYERQVEQMRAALEPFAAVADEYHDSDDDNWEVWIDAGPQRLIRSTFELAKFRRARTALATPDAAVPTPGNSGVAG